MTRPLAVGVQVPEAERTVTWPEYASMARAADAIGLDSIWMGDHLLYRADDEGPERGPFDAWAILAGIAAVTERVRLGPLVACTAFLEPGILARKAATVDAISGGRLTLGVGAGWNRPEFEAFGLAWDHRASRFEEAFTIVRRLLAGERVTFEGRFHRTQDAVLLPAPERVPRLMVGSLGDRVLASTLPWVDAWNAWGPWCGNTPDGFAAANDRVSSAVVAAGRDPAEVGRSICVYTEIGPTPEDTWFEEDAPPLTGTPSEIADGLQAFAEAGADEAILVLNVATEATILGLAPMLAALDG
ncbi:MAG TPA: LLM class flavin-dependent oxidoreductase [Actinomycetota bacterium]|nr:LLM class flavin-dependent oxidoreductase [Actinomycetota bacterium]